jgi:hypothetical protein
MSETADPPFRMVKYFFTSVDLKRIPVMPDNLELDLEMQLGVHADQLPDRLQLNLKAASKTREPLDLDVEFVALFERLEGQPEPSQEALEWYINERALYMMLPLMQDMIRRTTAAMGMKPLEMRVPYRYDFRLNEMAYEEEE